MSFRQLVYLAGVVPLLAAGAEAAGGQDEDLLGDGVDLAHALVVLHHRHGRRADPQRDGAGCRRNGRIQSVSWRQAESLDEVESHSLKKVQVIPKITGDVGVKDWRPSLPRLLEE